MATKILAPLSPHSQHKEKNRKNRVVSPLRMKRRKTRTRTVAFSRRQGFDGYVNRLTAALFLCQPDVADPGQKRLYTHEISA
jgi:hypothetical protein